MILSDWLDLCERKRKLWPHAVIDPEAMLEWHATLLGQPEMTRRDVEEAVQRLAMRLSFPPTLDEIVAETTAVWEANAARQPKAIDPPVGDPEFRERWMALVPRMLLAVDDDAVRAIFLSWKRRKYVPDEPLLSPSGVPFSDWRPPESGELLNEMAFAAAANPDWKRRAVAVTGSEANPLMSWAKTL